MFTGIIKQIISFRFPNYSHYKNTYEVKYNNLENNVFECL